LFIRKGKETKAEIATQNTHMPPGDDAGFRD